MVVVIIGPELKTTPLSSDSGVSQVTTQEATRASPSTPRLAERTLGMMNDDAASTVSASPSLTDMTVVDAVSTFPFFSRLTDTEGTLVANSGAAKESTCITLPVPRWLVLDFTLVSFVDSASAAVLKQLHHDLQIAGVKLCLASASDRVLQALEKCGVLQEITSDLIFHSIHDAVAVITCTKAHQANDLQKS
ncbi:uncharacterized protein LOC126991720 [Eriocheir sinensis]|uniref:uncharacterized protein LOC126991720 n=1 Tax=Eriocheir sinensis TaxID=95602 RepID=UPI0021C99469|nr:uncharacterized protein LOC126991720 [Eriocheir sinensis]